MDILVLDGELVAKGQLAKLVADAEQIVAADGAAEHLAELGVTADVIIGDLDTADPAFIAEKLADKTTDVVQDTGQEKNDGEKGLDYLVSHGATDIVVLGAGGGMIDHVLNNFSILTRYAAETRIRTIDERCVGYFVTDRLTIETTPEDRISIIPMPGAQVTSSGLHWEGDGSAIAWGFREGASNRATGNEVEIEIRNGTVVLFHYPASDD